MKPKNSLLKPSATKSLNNLVNPKLFPMLSKTMHSKPLVYLDTAATALKPQTVIDAMQGYYQEHYSTVHRAVYQLATEATEKFHQVRCQVADFIHAHSEREIIFTRGTTDAINLVATSFGEAFINKGDEVILSEIEHHANIVPWQICCEKRGAKLRIIPVLDNGELDLEAFQKLLNDKTKIVAVGHISNAIGTLHPIRKIVTMAHAVGAKVLVDGAQAIPHMPVNVQALDVDFYAFSGHKSYGPTGIGVLYGKEKLLESMPPYQGGGDMIERVTFKKTTYAPLPMKFEAGTPNIAGVIGLGSALQFLSQINMDAICEYEQKLLEYATTSLLTTPKIRLIGTAPQKGSIVSFVIDGTHPLDLGTLLDFHGIAIRTGHHCAQPTMQRFGVDATARFSFGIYNTKEEIDYAVEALKLVVKQCS